MKYETIRALKDLRKYHHYTQNDIAFILGISSRCYRAKEKGESYFNQGEIITLSYLFEMDDEDIIKFFFSKENNRKIFLKLNIEKMRKKEYITEIIELKNGKYGNQVLNS